MTQEIINIGAQPNDGEGDPLRTAFQKINNNFSQLYSTGFFTSNAETVGNTAQVIFETPSNVFTQGTFQINSQNVDNMDSQNITLNASILNDGSGVKWNGHSTIFNGNYLTQYNMDLVDSNVRILVTPLTDNSATLFHFISSQITWTGETIPGLNILLNGYTDIVMETENDLDLQTESDIII